MTYPRGVAKTSGKAAGNWPLRSVLGDISHTPVR